MLSVCLFTFLVFILDTHFLYSAGLFVLLITFCKFGQSYFIILAINVLSDILMFIKSKNSYFFLFFFKLWFNVNIFIKGNLNSLWLKWPFFHINFVFKNLMSSERVSHVQMSPDKYFITSQRTHISRDNHRTIVKSPRFVFLYPPFNVYLKWLSWLNQIHT